MAIDKTDKYIQDELLTRQVASLLASGSSIRQIAEVLNISWDRAKKIAALDSTKTFMKEVGEVAIAAAKAQLRQRLSKMSDMILKAIEEKIKYEMENPGKSNLEGCKVALKSMGMETADPSVPGQAQQLTVVFPSTAKTVEVIKDADIPEGN